MLYAFKPNPKQLASDKAHKLYGNGAKVEVTGTRLSALDCKKHGIPAGSYYVECRVDGQCIATAHTKDWRKAYKLLVVEIEKAFEKSLYQNSAV